jgi:CheY-like chemotaxis protein
MTRWETVGGIIMEEQSSAVRRKQVLVVDDNVELAQTWKELLEAHDYEVAIASNGVLALKLLLNTDVDAIVCDLSMPQLEGDMFHVTVERVRPHLAKRFIFLTGHVGHPKYEAFLQKATSPVLYKPVSIDSLLEALRGLFAQAA